MDVSIKTLPVQTHLLIPPLEKVRHTKNRPDLLRRLIHNPAYLFSSMKQLSFFIWEEYREFPIVIIISEK